MQAGLVGPPSLSTQVNPLGGRSPNAGAVTRPELFHFPGSSPATQKPRRALALRERGLQTAGCKGPLPLGLAVVGPPGPPLTPVDQATEPQDHIPRGFRISWLP